MTPSFEALLAQVLATAERFGHRQHVHVTWLAVRAVGAGAAIPLVCDGIRRTARYAGAPQKYHHTISRAWVELVALGTPADDFDAFVAANPGLLDKRRLNAFYRPGTLATPAAKQGWVPPDRQAFTRGAAAGRSGPDARLAAALEPRGQLTDEQDDDDGRGDALPRLRKDVAAEQADRRVGGRPQPAGGHVRHDEGPP
jgi:hypothetical protein